MKFFLDTASLDQIRYWSENGLVDGVTTNPALLAREGVDALSQLSAIAELVSGPVSAQVTVSDAGGMVRQGERLAAIAHNVVVKLPATVSGLESARHLRKRGVSVNVTLGFDASQSIAFARVPVEYFSLVIGRVEDFGSDSLEQIAEARALIDNMGSPTELLVASIRNPIHLRAAIVSGADIVTVPPATWTNLFANPNTLQGLSDFSAAWSTLDEGLRDDYESLAVESD